jgi:hypothetical protein
MLLERNVELKVNEHMVWEQREREGEQGRDKRGNRRGGGCGPVAISGRI